MRPTHIFLILISITALFSCNGGKNATGDGATIEFRKIDGNNIPPHLKVEFLTLSIPPGTIIGDVTNLLTDKEVNLFFIDIYQKQVYAYYLDQKTIALVGMPGRGKGEYISPGTLSLSRDKDIITVVDDSTLKLLKYRVEDGKFISSVEAPFNTGCIEYMESGNILWDNHESGSSQNHLRYNYIISDAAGNPVKWFIERGPYSGYSTGPDKIMYIFEDQVYSFLQHDANVYRITNHAAEPVYNLVFDKLSFAPAQFLREHNKTSSFFNKLSESGYISHHEVFETANMLLVKLIANKTKYVAFYDKKEGEGYIVTLEDFRTHLGLPGIDFIAGVFGDKIAFPLLVNDVRDSDPGSLPGPDSYIQTIKEAGANDIVLVLLSL